MNPFDVLQGDPVQRMIDARTPKIGGPAGQLLGGPAMRPDPTIPLLPPDQEEGALDRLGSAGLGALHFIGSTLDKTFGGRAIRGVLGGHPEELASIIPGSDWMGLSDEKNRVSGEDLLKNAGLLGERDPDQGWIQARDFAGPAVEMALDPATYLTLGTGSALTEAGQAAEKAGTLADTAAGRIAAGQSGLVGLGLPFSKPSVILGTGATGEKIGGLIDKGVDRLAYGNLPYTNFSPGRTFSALFDKSVNGTASEAAQRAARAMTAATPEAEAAGRGRVLDIGKTLAAHGIDQADPALRAILEGTASALPGSGMEAATGAIRNHLKEMADEAQGLGRDLNERANYAPRQMVEFNQPTKGYGPGPGADFPVRSANEKARIDPFNDVPGETATINAMSVDSAISGPGRTLQGPPGNMLREQEYIRHNYLGGSPQQDAERFALHQSAPPAMIDVPHPTIPGQTIKAPNPDYERMLQLDAMQKKSEDLAEIMAGLDPQHASTGTPLFGNTVLSDIEKYAANHARAQLGGNAIHDMLARSAEVGAATPETVPLIDALEKAGLGKNISQMQGNGPGYGAQATIRKRLEDLGVLAPGADLMGVRVPKSVAEDAAHFNQGFRLPGPLQPLAHLWDSATNLNKAFMNSFWPAARARDAVTGLWNNAVAGAVDPAFAAANPLAHLSGPIAADLLQRGETIPGIAAQAFPHAAGLTDEAASNLLREAVYKHQVLGAGSELANVAGQNGLPAGARAVLPNTPEAVERGLLATANPANALPKKLADLNPLDVRGVGGRQTTGNTLVKYGHDLSDAIDENNRVGAFINLKRQGYTDAAAAAKANATHYDYSNLSNFENQVMRRVVPYYNWLRQNVPFQVEQLATHPGGLTASAIKAIDSSRPEGFIPHQIADEGGLAVGKEESGNQRYLTSLGLPYEDLADFIGSGPRPGQNLLEKLAGDLNPMIKAPLEYATNKQFFSDRDLTDLHSRTGNIALDQIIMNSPLQRFSGLGSTLLDERKDAATKALNLLSPGKVTDVDLEKQRGIDARDQLEEMFKGNPNIRHMENFYVKPEDAPNLTPDELRMMELYRTLEVAQQKASVAKKKYGGG